MTTGTIWQSYRLYIVIRPSHSVSFYAYLQEIFTPILARYLLKNMMFKHPKQYYNFYDVQCRCIYICAFKISIENV